MKEMMMMMMMMMMVMMMMMIIIIIVSDEITSTVKNIVLFSSVTQFLFVTILQVFKFREVLKL